MSAGTIGSESFNAPQGGNPFTSYMGTQPGGAVSQQPSAAEFNTGLLPQQLSAEQQAGIRNTVNSPDGMYQNYQNAVFGTAPSIYQPNFGQPTTSGLTPEQQGQIQAQSSFFQPVPVTPGGGLIAQPDGSYTMGDGGEAYKNYQNAVFGNQPNIYQPNFGQQPQPMPTGSGLMLAQPVDTPRVIDPYGGMTPGDALGGGFAQRLAQPVDTPRVIDPYGGMTPGDALGGGFAQQAPVQQSAPIQQAQQNNVVSKGIEVPLPVPQPSPVAQPKPNPFAKKSAPAPRAPTPRAPTRRSVQPRLMAKPTPVRR